MGMIDWHVALAKSAELFALPMVFPANCCASCRWYDITEEHLLHEYEGFCRRYPPVFTNPAKRQDADSRRGCDWNQPIVLDWECCGEWRAKE